MNGDVSMVARAAAVWFVLLLAAVAAAAVRTGVLEPRFGESTAHVVGTLFVMLVFVAIIWQAAPWVVPDLARARLASVGLSWTVATVAFEFGFGHYIMGHSWSRLLADYDLTSGRLWILVLLTLLLMPLLTGALRRGSP